jgi:hypothetical protein
MRAALWGLAAAAVSVTGCALTERADQRQTRTRSRYACTPTAGSAFPRAFAGGSRALGPPIRKAWSHGFRRARASLSGPDGPCA